jgi:Flp pilus assembly protein TadB
VPTRKQRRRQAKGRRHEYEYVYVDDQGNEVEGAAPAEEAPAKPRSQGTGVRPTGAKQTDKQPAQRGARQARGALAPRKVDPPSWRKVGRRAAIFAPIMVVVVYLLKPSGATTASIIVQVVVLILFFLPFSYFVDSMMYRQYRKRIGDPIPPRERKPPGRKPPS